MNAYAVTCPKCGVIALLDPNPAKRPWVMECLNKNCTASFTTNTGKKVTLQP